MANDANTTKVAAEKNSGDPFAHERGLGQGVDNLEDPLGEYRNEGFGNSKGWHQGGDFGGGQAANLGRSAGEVALEDNPVNNSSEPDPDGDAKADENKRHQDGADTDTAGSQKSQEHEAPGSNTASTSTGVVEKPGK